MLSLASFRMRSPLSFIKSANKSAQNQHLCPCNKLSLRMCKYQHDSCTSSKHQIKYKPYVPPCYTDHDHKNMKLGRPMSPHLTIYGPTLTSFTSIMQRISGVIVTTYALGLAGGALLLPNGIDTYVTLIQDLDLAEPILMTIKIIIGLPSSYHYANGMRFCAWNAGLLLNMKGVYTSGYLAIVGGFALSVFFCFL